MSCPLTIRGVGGLDEIGGSCLVVSCGQDTILIDFGMRPGAGTSPLYPELHEAIPTGEILFLTHGHLDHTGGFSLFREIYPECRIAGSAETSAITAARGDARGVDVLQPWEPVFSGGFSIIPFPVSHSVPGAYGYIITHSGKTVVLSGDFNTRKFSEKYMQIWSKVAELAEDGIHLFLCDGTGLRSEEPGTTEDEVAVRLRDIFVKESGDIYATCFSSNWERLAALCGAAEASGRDVYLSGTAMVKSAAAAARTGYGVLSGTNLPQFRGQNGKKLVIASGSQGESFSGFCRLSGEGSPVTAEDAVVFSASPVPGNELPVRHILDRFSRITSKIYAPPLDRIHAGGHASRSEIRAVLEILKPEAWLPVHCDPNAAATASRADMPAEVPFRLARGAVIVVDSGVRLEVPGSPSVRFSPAPPAAEKQRLFEEGFLHLSIGRNGTQLGSAVLVTRGFVRRKSEAAFLEEIRMQAEGCAEEGLSEGVIGSAALARRVEQELGEYIHARSGKSPEIIVSFMECPGLRG